MRVPPSTACWLVALLRVWWGLGGLGGWGCILAFGGVHAPPPLQGAAHVPLRLTMVERKAQRLIASCISVSDYTDKVDRADLKPSKRVQAQLRQAHAILSGLEAASHQNAALQALSKHRSLEDKAALFQTTLEIARRYKIMNPDLMRSEYPKLMHFLQVVLPCTRLTLGRVKKVCAWRGEGRPDLHATSVGCPHNTPPPPEAAMVAPKCRCIASFDDPLTCQGRHALRLPTCGEYCRL